MGLYYTWNFYLPDLSGYEKNNSNYYDGDGKISRSHNDRGLRTYEGFEWIVGYKFNIIPGFLMIPIGAGANHSKELRLFNDLFYDGSIYNTKWYSPPDYSINFAFEIGLQIILGKFITIGSTYRVKSFKESFYTINAGIFFN
jgi:hypothetical protein